MLLRAVSQGHGFRLRRAAREIRPGVSAFLYPEGTRTRDGALQPFKKGGCKLALQTGLPVGVGA